MKIQSNLVPREYLSAMQDHMSGHLEFGNERFTGFFIGSCFYITYHSGYEWDRRINNPKNAAMGFARKSGNGSEIHIIRFRGALCPLVFIPLLLISLLFSSICIPFELIPSLSLGFVIAVFAATGHTFSECLSQRSEEGRRTLLSLLLDPADPYANYHNIP